MDPGMQDGAVIAPASRRSPGLLVLLSWVLLFTALVANLGLFLWMAPRGFDWTDEAYYLLNYLHWRELYGTPTFFGALLEWPFRLVGGNLGVFRVSGMVLLAAAAAWCVHCCQRKAFVEGAPDAPGRAWLGAAVAVTGAFLFYAYLKFLRSPSYNLLAVASMLATTGILVHLAGRSMWRAADHGLLVAYGGLIAVLGIAKPTSGLLTLGAHLLYFAISNSAWRPGHLAAAVVLPLAGGAMCFALLWWAHPNWIGVLFKGAEFARILENRTIPLLLQQLSWDLQRKAWVLLPWGGLALVACLLAGRQAHRDRWQLSGGMLAFAATGSLVATLTVDVWRPYWLLVACLAIAGLVIFEWGRRGASARGSAAAGHVALTSLLLFMPVAASFGTNMAVLAHSQQAAVFAVIALMLSLTRMSACGAFRPAVVVVCAVMLACPALWSQWRAVEDPEANYRQVAALRDQDHRVRLDGLDILVDAATAGSMQALQAMARQAGLRPGTYLLDFSGDGPGMVFILQGRPQGLAWLFGGYPGSHQLADRLLRDIPDAVLRQAWILSADTGPRAIAGWQGLLAEHIGVASHELAGRTEIVRNHGWGNSTGPTVTTVELWRPR